MRISVTIPLHQTNSEAERPGSRVPTGTETRRARLALLVQARAEAWLSLYGEPDVWTDPEKRHTMLRSRLKYTDTLAAYVAACRRRRRL